MLPVTDSPARRPGGRTARNTAAVFAATVDELADRGYEETSIESIAARAGVHKTTVYRRWGSKPELVRQALGAAAQSMIEVPDTGDIGSDLRLLSRSVQATLGSPRGAGVTRGLLAGAAGAPEIRAMMTRFWDARLAAIAAIVTRAVVRGQLPDGTEPGAVLRAMAAPLYYRLLVTGEELTPGHADEAAAAALAAALAGVFRAPQSGPARLP